MMKYLFNFLIKQIGHVCTDTIIQKIITKITHHTSNVARPLSKYFVECALENSEEIA